MMSKWSFIVRISLVSYFFIALTFDILITRELIPNNFDIPLYKVKQILEIDDKIFILNEGNVSVHVYNSTGEVIKREKIVTDNSDCFMIEKDDCIEIYSGRSSFLTIMSKSGDIIKEKDFSFAKFGHNYYQMEDKYFKTSKKFIIENNVFYPKIYKLENGKKTIFLENNLFEDLFKPYLSGFFTMFLFLVINILSMIIVVKFRKVVLKKKTHFI